MTYRLLRSKLGLGDSHQKAEKDDEEEEEEEEEGGEEGEGDSEV